MRAKERIQSLRMKPFRVTCFEGDYSASFATINEARQAKLRHQNRFPTHQVVITNTIILSDND